MGYKGHYGEYTGNAKWSKNYADTKVTKGNYKASERDDAAHIDYLKRDIDYDNKHGHSDESMTADEKHISKLAGDMKYDKKSYGSPARSEGGKDQHRNIMNSDPNPGPGGAPGGLSDAERWSKHQKFSKHHGGSFPSSPAKMDSPARIEGGKIKHEKYLGRKLDGPTWGSHKQGERHHRGPEFGQTTPNPKAPESKEEAEKISKKE